MVTWGRGSLVHHHQYLIACTMYCKQSNTGGGNGRGMRLRVEASVVLVIIYYSCSEVTQNSVKFDRGLCTYLTCNCWIGNAEMG